MKKLISLILTVVTALSLCACGSIYNRDYLVIEEYIVDPQPTSATDSVTVKRYNQLKNSIMELVLEGDRSGKIIFDTNYNGDPAEDMASACWELRSQNALCAYCVANIAYELSQIVTYYEANVNISYADVGIKVSDVAHLHYAYQIKELITEAMNAGINKIAALVDSGYYSAEDVQKLVSGVYYAHPTAALTETNANVNVYSGISGQKLYEIEIDYGYEAHELAAAKRSLSQLRPFFSDEAQNSGEGQRAFIACEYLTENCTVSADKRSSAYDALLDGEADSKGIALAYVELCRELGIKCEIVFGQHNWTEHCWNIVEIDGDRYHVDVSACISSGMESGFLYTDNEFWENYRWDIASYPKCSGEITLKEIMENM